MAEASHDDDDDESDGHSEGLPVVDRRNEAVKKHLSAQRQPGLMDERMWKVLCVGEVGVGKTAYLQRVVHDVFRRGYKSTIGVDFLQKTLVFNKGVVTVRVQLWDVAGQGRVGNMTRVYFKEARGAIVVCDNRTTAFRKVQVWKDDIDKKVLLPDQKRKIPCLLLITKSDLKRDDDYPTDKEIKAYAKKAGFVGYKIVSSMSGKGCNTALESFIKYMYRIDVDNVSLQARQEAAKEKDGIVTLLKEGTNDEDDFTELLTTRRKCQQC